MAANTRPASRSSKAPPPPKPSKTERRQQKRKQEVDELQVLQKRVDEFDPKSTEAKTFADLPLSQPTAAGLQASHFTSLTDIQARAIPLALHNHDVLGAAKTGSGKTLAFLVPVLDKLYRAQWTEFDGLGALIISPTRELAVQIFEVLRKIGRKHAFSAGLVIGGKSLKEEAERLSRMNILVCTPGRMLQHLDQTAGFDADNLQILVLDEADRIMDMGFQTAVDALVEHLPKTRQTLMFSATQSKKVSDLARLSLKDPEYVSVHESASHATPSNLQQNYIVTPLHEKLDTLYGFIKANLKSKIIVFLSSGKQVRFVYESFRHLQPGIPLLHLHGRQKQIARLEITNRFTAAKHSCLFATDVVARGIDFPAVDWVIQVDCPEDTDTYIHRVGRTARYQSNGRAVLFLDPSEEEGMVKKLEQKKIPIHKVHVKDKKKRSIKNSLQNMCFQNPDLKYLGQKAFISYARAIHLQKDKDVFKLNELDLDAFSASLGLPGTPQIRFHKGEDVKKIKNAPRQGMSSGSESEMDMDGVKKPRRKKDEVRTKYDKMFERTNQDVLSSHYNKLVLDGDGKGAGSDDDDAEFLSVKRRLNDDELDEESKKAPVNAVKVIEGLGGKEPFVVDSKRREKVLQSKKKLLKFKGNPTKMVYDDEGNAHPVYELANEDDFKQEGPAEELRKRFVEGESAKVKEADVDDKQLLRERRREKKAKRKAREAMERAGIDPDKADDPALPQLDAEEDVDRGAALDFLRSLPTDGADRRGEEESGREEEEEEEEPPRKKAKKWFQDDDEDEQNTSERKSKKKRGKVFELEQEPETLEDLEALATGLLDG
ncbi:ATP-dependent RNA helicase-like protein [Hapsidospora chrysogenum ATCC 11550]|uniref:ATP-dependent RNA helicase n=1 Tax=Hapsidospora chrysogenum (strain ATCC 11550 / CBS 779.69 / DSM 880 / IAM 14645 / JCM 23072 / IMI 49137) TaxID=857340 RepID=A0A086T7H2_HAPC1|nr:ATP-dependent RNA helicase-like protein [Hapsidospora chrysogenum ATCC 11550]